MADEIKKEDAVDDSKKNQVALSEEQIDAILKENEELSARNEELNENLNQIAAERENYKKVALSKKGKLPDEDESGEDLEEKVSKIVRETLSGTKEAQLLKEKDQIVKRLNERNKELTVALKNRAQVTTRTGGGSQEETKSDGVNFWEEKQLEYFKKRGLDPNKVKENYLKIQNK